MTVESDGWAFNVELTHLYRDVMWLTERATGMSQTRLDILHELFHAQELSQAELQQHLGVEGPVITRIVKQMEADGLVTRRPDPRDNRYTLVAMSEQTRRTHAGVEATNFKEMLGAQMMQGLDDSQREALLRMIRQIAENVHALRESGKITPITK